MIRYRLDETNPIDVSIGWLPLAAWRKSFMDRENDDTECATAGAAGDECTGNYVLRLYVTGMTPRSSRAIATIKSICEEHLEGRYDLEVIDIYQQPVLARDEQIIATPTLVKKLPTPLRRFIGDLSDEERVLFGLDLRQKE